MKKLSFPQYLKNILPDSNIQEETKSCYQLTNSHIGYFWITHLPKSTFKSQTSYLQCLSEFTLPAEFSLSEFNMNQAKRTPQSNKNTHTKKKKKVGHYKQRMENDYLYMRIASRKLKVGNGLLIIQL